MWVPSVLSLPSRIDRSPHVSRQTAIHLPPESAPTNRGTSGDGTQVSLPHFQRLVQESPELLQRLIDTLEQDRTHPILLLVSLFGIIFIRMILESTVYIPGKVFGPLNYLLHFNLFYLSLFVCLSVLLQFLTGERILKITRCMVPCMMVIWLAPIVDFAISGFGDTTPDRLIYVKGNLAFLMRQFLTFYGDMAEETSVLGLKCEIALILLGIGAYVWIKTKDWVWVVLAVFLAHALIFAHGTIPPALNDWIGFRQEHGHAPFLSAPKARSSLLGMALIGASTLWYRAYHAGRFRALLGNIRPMRLVHYQGMLFLGFYLGTLRFADLIKTYDWTFWAGCLTLCVVVFCVWMSSVYFNDVADFAGDRLSNPERPLVRGDVSRNHALGLGMLFALTALLFAAMTTWTSLALVIFCQSISIIYSFEPVRLKRIPLVSTFMISAGSLAIVAMGYALVANVSAIAMDESTYALLAGFPTPIAGMILICFTLSFTTKDIKDLDGDRASKIWTLPVLLGSRRGKICIGILVSLSYLAVPLILDLPLLFFFSIPAAMVNFVLINQPRTRETWIFIVYYVYMTAVAAVVLQDPAVLLGT